MNELKAKEKLPDVPKLVKQYLDTTKHKAVGKFFRITVKQESDPKQGAGIAYSNELVVEKKTSDKWKRQYGSGMRQYRGAYNYEIDNWNLALHDPSILKETETEMTYAVRTGAGNIEVYRFKDEPVLEMSFKKDGYESTQKRIELLQKLVDDAEAFRAYVDESLDRRWYVTGDHKKDDLLVLLVDHADRDYDAISDLYRIYFWVKGKGFGVTETHRTGLHHPGGKFYRVGIGFRVTVVSQDDNTLNLSITVGNKSQQWNVDHKICVKC